MATFLAIIWAIGAILVILGIGAGAILGIIGTFLELVK